MTHFKIGLLVLVQLALAYGSGSPAELPAASVSASAVGGSASAGPESRQITASLGGQSGVQGSAGPGSVYPYNMYQNSVYGAGPKAQTPSSGGSSSSGWLSFLRPSSSSSGPSSGRRSSLTSRLRNFVSNIFYRREQSPYLGSGSSNFYAYRQPPFGFNSNAFSGGGGGGGPSAGGPMGSMGPGNQNMFGSASQFRPIVYPGFESAAVGGGGGVGAPGNVAAAAGLWNNYKQWASNNNNGGGGHGMGSGAAANTANYAWSPPGASATGSGYNHNVGNGNGNQAQFQGNGNGGQGGQGQYQGAASMAYPSTSYSNYNQRSGLSSNFKPVQGGQPGGQSADNRSSGNSKPVANLN